MSDLDKINTYQRAEKRVKEEKNFYTHVLVYLIINIVMLIVILNLKHYIYDGYLIWNILSTPLIWGIFLLAHGVKVFKKGKRLKRFSDKLIPFKKWEERKIKELIENDDTINNNTYE